MRSAARGAAILLACSCAAACHAGGGGSGGGGSAGCRSLVPDTGALAADYLTDATYPALTIEVDWLDGPALEPDRYAPDAQALQFLHDEIAKRVRKPSGIDVVLDDRIPRSEARPRYGLGDLDALEAAHRGRRSGDAPGVAVLYVLYVDGPCALGGDILGLNFGGSSIAVFDETLHGAASLVEDRRRAESMLLLHEAGHALGLVNLGTPATAPHADPRSPCHDRSAACVMFRRIESGLVGSLGDPPLGFDRACQEDIEAAGGLPAGP